jgi:transcription elongation factor GreA
VERPRVIHAIADARRHGDLSENAEYHAAKENQRLIEARIADIELKLISPRIINVSEIDSDVIIFGASVDLFDEASEKKIHYQIVGEDEADIASGLVSIASPLAKALLGKEVGDTVEVATPGGKKNYEILGFAYR